MKGKKLFCLLLSCLLIAGTLLTGCGGKDGSADPGEQEQGSDAEEPDGADGEEADDEDKDDADDKDDKDDKGDKDDKAKENGWTRTGEEKFGMTMLDFDKIPWKNAGLRFYGLIDAPFELNTAAAYFDELSLGSGPLDPLNYKGITTPLGEEEVTGSYTVRGGLSKGAFSVLGIPAARADKDDEDDDDDGEDEDEKTAEPMTVGETLAKGNFRFSGWYDPDLLFTLDREHQDSYSTEDLQEILFEMLDTFGPPTKVYYLMFNGDDQREATFLWNRETYGFTLTLNDYYYEDEEKLSLVDCSYYGQEAIRLKYEEMEAIIGGYDD